MPAKNLKRVDDKGIYLHLYNKGIEDKFIFKDEQDYEVFVGYLNDYLTPPKDPDSMKKTFQVKGVTFKGIPHQPKNYLNKIELMAYCLMPDHFHLLLHQVTSGSVEKFIRSLCTRYSMYFNKKYKRAGALFAGPYKSALIKDSNILSQLTGYLHFAGDHSSSLEYLGLRQTEWVKPQIVISSFEQGVEGYKNFVEKYKPGQSGDEEIDGFIFEDKSLHLERSKPVKDDNDVHISSSKPRSRLPEYLAVSTLMFLVLVTLGVRNIMASQGKDLRSTLPTQLWSWSIPFISQSAPDQLAVNSSESTSTPAVLGAPAEETEEKVEEPIINTLMVKVEDENSRVNIRQEPNSKSKKIGKASNGDVFEYISKVSGWYEIKLDDGSTGFISEEFVTINEFNN